jgi:hypothetical protein
MQHRFSSILGYIGSVAAATLAAALMSGNALAEGPISDQQPFTGSLSRAQVKAELMNGRGQLTSFASEWTLQQQTPLHAMSSPSREQVRAEYLASREQVRAMTAEHGGSGHFAYTPVQTPASTLVASEAR